MFKKLFKKKNYYQVGFIPPKKLMEGHSYQYLEMKNVKIEEGITLEEAKEIYKKKNPNILKKWKEHQNIDVMDYIEVINAYNIQVLPYYLRNASATIEDDNGILKVSYKKALIEKARELNLTYLDTLNIKI